MKIGVPKESDPRESRVATTPKVIGKLQKLGFSIVIEKGAGENSSISDSKFEQAGASIVDTAAEVWSTADIILKMRPPTFREDLDIDECDLAQEGQTLICMVQPGENNELVEKLQAKGITLFALECIPRITRRRTNERIFRSEHDDGRVVCARLREFQNIERWKTFGTG